MALADSGPRAYTVGPYLNYQERYAQEPRESDKVLIRLVGAAAASAGRRPLRVLDIGCSSGNLMLHIARAQPDLELTGAELFPEIVEQCRRDARLSAFRFEVMDIRALPSGRTFDIVVVSAVLGRFDLSEFESCCRGINGLLAPGGSLLAFDWYHAFQQDLAIRETSRMHPEGIMLHMRSFDSTRSALERAGFASVDFHSFDIPIDLQFPGHEADLFSYTRKEEGTGARMTFRGALYQPWCHLVARKG